MNKHECKCKCHNEGWACPDCFKVCCDFFVMNPGESRKWGEMLLEMILPALEKSKTLLKGLGGQIDDILARLP